MPEDRKAAFEAEAEALADELLGRAEPWDDPRVDGDDA